MSKIINTFKYGSSEVKRVLLLTILSGIATVVLAVLAIVGLGFVFFFGALIMLFVTISLAQTMGIKQGESDSNLARPIGEAYSDGIRNDTVRIGEPETYAAPNISYVPQDNMATVESTNEDEVDIIYANDDDMDELSEAISSGKISKKKAEKIKKKKQKKAKKAKIEKAKKDKTKKEKTKKKKLVVVKNNSAEPTEEASVQYSSDSEADELDFARPSIGDETEVAVESTSSLDDDLSFLDELEEEETEEEEEAKVVQITEEEAKSYDKKKIKKTLHKFKVKKDHRMVMIDRCEKFNIKQTPAYIWKDGNVFNILLIEKEPRIVSLPLYMINEIQYLKKQPANEFSDYAVFKSARGMLVEMFRPYLPDYTHSTVVDDMSSYKNLYGIGPGIYFTNTSASSLFDLLSAEFIVKDKVTASNKVNVYFKEAYKANIKLRDNVIDANGYADSISRILDNLAKSTISYNEFKETLNLMIKNKLITEEFASYYMDVRNKLKG